MKNISIVIPTYNRKRQLTRCLSALSQQVSDELPIIVIDNDPLQSAKKVTNLFKEKNILYLSEKKRGVPHVRNKALEQVKTEWVSYLDDDCIPQENWFSTVSNLVRSNPKQAYFMGASMLDNTDSLVARSIHNFQEYWLRQNVGMGGEVGKYHLDTKNLVINTRLLKKNEIMFDSIFADNPKGDMSDLDLGYHLFIKGYGGKYVPELVVAHTEETSLINYCHKMWQKGKNAHLFEDKWEIEGQIIDLSEKNILRFVAHFRRLPRELKQWPRGSLIDKLLQWGVVGLGKMFYLRGYLNES